MDSLYRYNGLLTKILKSFSPLYLFSTVIAQRCELCKESRKFRLHNHLRYFATCARMGESVNKLSSSGTEILYFTACHEDIATPGFELVR